MPDLTYQQIEKIDAEIDAGASPDYQFNTLAIDWGRVAKCAEEAGEAIEAFIGCTGQNVRKGFSHSLDDVLSELTDVAVTALCAIQHFTKNSAKTQDIFESRVLFLKDRLCA